MPTVTVSIAEYKVSAEPDVTLVTYALGSCIAVIVHDPVLQVGGMIHYMLPLSKSSPEKAQRKPAMFCDTGVPLLFKEMYTHGSRKEDLVVKVAGGGRPIQSDFDLQIGKRNYLVLRKLFWKNGILIASEDVGGVVSRTARLQVGSGIVTIRARGVDKQV